MEVVLSSSPEIITRKGINVTVRVDSVNSLYRVSIAGTRFSCAARNQDKAIDYIVKSFLNKKGRK